MYVSLRKSFEESTQPQHHKTNRFYFYLLIEVWLYPKLEDTHSHESNCISWWVYWMLLLIAYWSQNAVCIRENLRLGEILYFNLLISPDSFLWEWIRERFHKFSAISGEEEVVLRHRLQMDQEPLQPGSSWNW